MFDSILSILFPERCRGCRTYGTALCAACLAGIRPAAAVIINTPAFALFDYSDQIVQKAIWELKYQRKNSAAKILTRHGAANILDRLTTILQPSSMVFVPIP